MRVIATLTFRTVLFGTSWAALFFRRTNLSLLDQFFPSSQLILPRKENLNEPFNWQTQNGLGPVHLHVGIGE